jgi:hypothetical protein
VVDAPVSPPARDHVVSPEPRRLGEPPRWARAAIIAVVVAPIVVAVVRAVRREWFPIGDSGLLYVRARDVLTSHHPLLGSWTSASLSVGENMNNPGALYHDLLAPTSRLLGFSSAAAIGVGAVNAGCVVGAVAAAPAIGGWAMQRWMLLACALVVWIMGSELLIDIWQPHALLLPFLLYLVLIVGLAVGQARWLPWCAGVASLLLQTHVSYVFVLTLLTATAAFVYTATHWPIPWGRWRAALRSRYMVTTIVVVLVLWAQPSWEQAFGAGKGNLGRLLTNASGGDVKLGVSIATRFSARTLMQPAWRLRSGFSDLIPPTHTVEGPDGPFVEVTRGMLGFGSAAVLLLAVGLLLMLLGRTARRRDRPAQAAACWIAAGGVLGAPLCLSLVTVGTLFGQHHVRWMWVFGAFVNTVVVWALVDLVVDAVRSRLPAAARVGAVFQVALAALVAVAAVPYFAQPQGPVADYAAMPALRRVFRDLEPLRSSAPLLYDTSNVRVFEPYSGAVMMRLQELGIEFRVTDEGMIRQLGERRRADGTETTTLFQLERSFALTYEGPACLVTIASALDPDAEARAQVTADEIAAGIASGVITIDIASLDPAQQQLAAAAAAGDEGAAWRLVIEGAIEDTTLAGDAGLAAGLPAVRHWVDSTYALFALDPHECPGSPG